MIAYIMFFIILLALPTTNKANRQNTRTQVHRERCPVVKKPTANNLEMVRALQDQLAATAELALEYDKSADNIHRNTLEARSQLTKAIQSKKRVKELEKQASESNILKAARLRKAAMDMYTKAATIQARIDKLQPYGS